MFFMKWFKRKPKDLDKEKAKDGQDKDKKGYSKKDEDEVKERLKSLGYM